MNYKANSYIKNKHQYIKEKKNSNVMKQDIYWHLSEWSHLI